jgi:hypothetical protein
VSTTGTCSRENKSKGSKRFDIQLTTDMLLHAVGKNSEVAIVIAADEDYVPLV